MAQDLISPELQPLAQQYVASGNPLPTDASKVQEWLRGFINFAVPEIRKAAISGDTTGAQKQLEGINAVAPLIGPNFTIDEETGQVREKSWWEANKKAVLTFGALVGGGLAAGALAGGSTAAAPVTAPSVTGTSEYGPLASGYAGATTAADVTVPEALSGAGAYAPEAVDGLVGTGEATVSSVPATAEGTTGVVGAATGGASTAGSVGSGLTTAQRIAQMIRAGGQGIGAASNAAGVNRRSQDDFGLNLAGEEDARYRLGLAANQEEDTRSKLEADQRNQALKDAYRQNWYQTRTPGPYDPKPLTPLTPEFAETLAVSGQRARDLLTTDPQYAVNKLRPVQDPSTLPALPTGPTKPSTLETIGNWLGPALSTYGAISGLL